MKTITEFSGFTLIAAHKKAQELTASGKTAEELPAAMGEAYKLEGDKLKHFLAALEISHGKSDHLKRVVVLSLAEGEQAPTGALQKESNAYVTEYFFVPQAQRGREGGREKGRGGAGKGRGGKGKGGGKGGGPGRGGPGRGGDRDGGRGRPAHARGTEKEAKSGGAPKVTPKTTPNMPPKVTPNVVPKAAAKATAEEQS